MASYQPIVNPFTGKLQLIRSDSAFHLKDNVPTYNDLPITGNAENDVRITADDDKMYTWGIASSSGLLADWKEIGSSTAVDWSAITGKPSSTPAEIDSSVDASSDLISKKHTQGTDQKLDEGGANEVAVADVKDAVDKKHTQNTDTKLDEGGANEVAVADVKDAVDKKHTQNTDTKLDEGGANEVAVADVKDAVDKKHTQNTDTGTDSTSFNIDNGGDHDGAKLDNTFVYGSDILTGGTPTADTQWDANQSPDKAVDNDLNTQWHTNGSTVPHWWKYDLGAGNEKIVRKLRYYQTGTKLLRNWQLQGSNDDSSWTTLVNVTDEPQITGWHEREFTNSTAYRYYRIYITLVWGLEQYGTFKEIEMMEVALDGIDFIEGDSTDNIDVRVKGILTTSIKDASGDNASTPAEINTHINSTSNPHSVDKDDVALGNVPNLDTTDAVNNEHTQNTDNVIELTEAPSSDHTATGIKCDFTAGENVVFGEVCYIKSDGKMWKGDADAVATSYCIAIALESITADSSGSFLLVGIARDDSWDWTVGSPIYLSTTAGAMTQTAPSGSGDIVQILGIATHADRIYFKPDLVQVEIS